MGDSDLGRERVMAPESAAAMVAGLEELAAARQELVLRLEALEPGEEADAGRAGLKERERERGQLRKKLTLIAAQQEGLLKQLDTAMRAARPTSRPPDTRDER